jgi:hypothetical protein
MRSLPGITTTKSKLTGARAQLAEAVSLGVRECALFLTCLCPQERFQLYQELKRVSPAQITFPFVHARSDMSEDEYLLLMECFGAQRFNLHPESDYPRRHLLSARVRERIFIENIADNKSLTKADIEGFGGICLDLSHLEELRRLDRKAFKRLGAFLDGTLIGANHISAITPKPWINAEGDKCYAKHSAFSLQEFSYLAAYPEHYFSDYCAIELENTIARQLEIISAIEMTRSHSLAATQAA